jgi:hypothetical protein
MTKNPSRNKLDQQLGVALDEDEIEKALQLLRSGADPLVLNDEGANSIDLARDVAGRGGFYCDPMERLKILAAVEEAMFILPISNAKKQNIF